MSSCWSSVQAVLGGRVIASESTGEEGTLALLRRRLLTGAAAADSVKNLEQEVHALERALAAAAGEREATEARRREAEARAEAVAAELRAAEEENKARVEEILRVLDEEAAADKRIIDLENLIRIKNNSTSKWRWF